MKRRRHKLKNDCFKCPTSVAMRRIERSFGYKIKGTIQVCGVGCLKLVFPPVQRTGEQKDFM
jgi:hypothetical protein